MKIHLKAVAGILAFASLSFLTGCASIPAILGVNPEHIHFEETELVAGARAPDFTLPLYDGQGEVTLSQLRGKPVVLVFGSYT